MITSLTPSGSGHSSKSSIITRKRLIGNSEVSNCSFRTVFASRCMSLFRIFFATYEYGRIYGAGKEVLHLLCNDALTRPIAARDERGFLGAAHLGKPGERRELLFLRLAVDIGVNEYETLIEPRERRVSNEVPGKYL